MRPGCRAGWGGPVAEQTSGRDWFKVAAIVAGVLAALAMVGGLVLIGAAFFWVGA